MNETKKTVKTALSFVLVIVLIVGTLFGIDLPIQTDTVPPQTDVGTNTPADTTQPQAPTEDAPVVDTPVVDAPTVETPTDNVADVETPVEDNTVKDDGVTNDVPQDSAPTETVTEVVDNSAETEVAEPTEENNTTATEGDVENA